MPLILVLSTWCFSCLMNLSLPPACEWVPPVAVSSSLCPQCLAPSAMSKRCEITVPQGSPFRYGASLTFRQSFLLLSWVCCPVTLPPSTRVLVLALPWGALQTESALSTLTDLKAIFTPSLRLLNQPFSITKVVVRCENCKKTLTVSKSNEVLEEFSFPYKFEWF